MAVTYICFLLTMALAGIHGFMGPVIKDTYEEERLLDILEEALVKIIDSPLGESKNTNWEVNDPASENGKWDYDSCIWHSGDKHGEDNDCRPGYVAIGACQSGKHRDCNGRSTWLICCKTGKVGSTTFSLEATCNNGWFAANAGKHLYCPDGQVVGGICGSGAKKDCERWGEGYHQKLTCCTSSHYTVLNSDCEWLHTNEWRKELMCPENKVMAGSCGSGSAKDCEYPRTRDTTTTPEERADSHMAKFMEIERTIRSGKCENRTNDMFDLKKTVGLRCFDTSIST